MKKKILVFDYWNRAVKNYIEPIKNGHDDIEILVVHFSKLANIDEEYFIDIDGIKCYDFRHFTKFRISKIISIVKPDLILLLNHNGLIDRAIYKLAFKAKIPAVYLQHGLSKPNYLGEKKLTTLLGKKYTLFRYFKTGRKNLSYLFFFIVASIEVDYLYLFKSELYKYLYTAIINPVRFLNCLPFNKSGLPSYFFVFGRNDKQALIKQFDIKEDIIKEVGFILFENYVKYEENKEQIRNSFFNNNTIFNKAKKTAILMPTINLEWNMPGYERTTFITYIDTIVKKLVYKNYNIIVKLHPSADVSLYDGLQNLDNVLIFQKHDLMELLTVSDIVISEPSTAIFPAVLLRKKIIMLRYNEFISNDFDFVKEGVAINCDSAADIDYLINVIINKEVNEDIFKQFEEKFCNYNGHLTSEQIANFILQL